MFPRTYSESNFDLFGIGIFTIAGIPSFPRLPVLNFLDFFSKNSREVSKNVIDFID